MRGSEEGCLAIDGLCTVDFVNGQYRRRGWYKYGTSYWIGIGSVFDMLYKYRAAPGKASVPVDSPRSRGSGNDLLFF